MRTLTPRESPEIPLSLVDYPVGPLRHPDRKPVPVVILPGIDGNPAVIPQEGPRTGPIDHKKIRRAIEQMETALGQPRRRGIR